MEEGEEAQSLQRNTLGMKRVTGHTPPPVTPTPAPAPVPPPLPRSSSFADPDGCRCCGQPHGAAVAVAHQRALFSACVCSPFAVQQSRPSGHRRDHTTVTPNGCQSRQHQQMIIGSVGDMRRGGRKNAGIR